MVVRDQRQRLLIQRNSLDGRAQGDRRKQARQGASLMWDIVILTLGFGFFVAGIGYAYVCERL
jgi:hypothetical protein